MLQRPALHFGQITARQLVLQQVARFFEQINM